MEADGDAPLLSRLDGPLQLGDILDQDDPLLQPHVGQRQGPDLAGSHDGVPCQPEDPQPVLVPLVLKFFFQCIQLLRRVDAGVALEHPAFLEPQRSGQQVLIVKPVGKDLQAPLVLGDGGIGSALGEPDVDKAGIGFRIKELDGVIPIDLDPEDDGPFVLGEGTGGQQVFQAIDPAGGSVGKEDGFGFSPLLPQQFLSEGGFHLMIGVVQIFPCDGRVVFDEILDGWSFSRLLQFPEASAPHLPSDIVEDIFPESAHVSITQHMRHPQ